MFCRMAVLERNWKSDGNALNSVITAAIVIHKSRWLKHQKLGDMWGEIEKDKGKLCQEYKYVFLSVTKQQNIWNLENKSDTYT